MRDNNFSGGLTVMEMPTLSAAPAPVGGNWLSTRESKQLARSADSKITHEHYRAMLTQTALTNVAALSTLESHLCETAPWGQEHYRKIMNAYTHSAAMKIVEW